MEFGSVATNANYIPQIPRQGRRLIANSRASRALEKGPGTRDVSHRDRGGGVRQRSSNLAESHSRLIIGVRLADSPPTIKSSVAAGTAAQTSHDASPGADPLPVQPKMLLDNPNERVLLFGNCVVVLLLAKPLSVSGVTAIEYAFEDVVSRGGWISYFSLVIPEQLADDGVARDRLARTLQRYTDRISGA